MHDMSHTLPGRMFAKFVDLLLRDGFGEEQDYQYRRQPAQCRLQPENVSPGVESDDDAADEWAKCRPDQSAGQKPAESGGAGSRCIDVAQTGGSDNEKRSALVCSEHAEDEI